MLCGATGVGKSSLVNDIFNLSVDNDNAATMGTEGRPETRGVKRFTNDESSINLYDSEGYEIGRVDQNEKIPAIIQKRAYRKIEITTQELKYRVENEINFLNMHSNNVYERLNSYCNNQYDKCSEEIHEYSNKICKEAIDCYTALGKFLNLSVEENYISYNIKSIPKLNYQVDFEDKVIENIANIIIIALVPVVGIFTVPKISSESNQTMYKSQLNDVENKLKEYCDEMCRRIEKNLRELQSFDFKESRA
ncbi:MAG: 50S ribosome-binding GTPase [Clostridiales bacterium]|nr:50S ribosome-binding GTPase [Clostridiales bacterium]